MIGGKSNHYLLVDSFNDLNCLAPGRRRSTDDEDVSAQNVTGQRPLAAQTSLNRPLDEVSQGANEPMAEEALKPKAVVRELFDAGSSAVVENEEEVTLEGKVTPKARSMSIPPTPTTERVDVDSVHFHLSSWLRLVTE